MGAWAIDEDETPSPQEEPSLPQQIPGASTDAASFRSNSDLGRNRHRHHEGSSSLSRWFAFTLPRHSGREFQDSAFESNGKTFLFKDKRKSWLPSPTVREFPSSFSKRTNEKNPAGSSEHRPMGSERRKEWHMSIAMPPASAPFTMNQTNSPGWETPWTSRVGAQGPFHARSREGGSAFDEGEILESHTGTSGSHDDSRWKSRRKRLRIFLLNNPYVPLLTLSFKLFRIINISFTAGTLAVAIRIRLAEMRYGVEGVVGSSPTLIIIFAPLTLVHVISAIYLEYFGRPLGLWRTSAKLAHTLSEVLFICAWSAALSLCFDNFFTSLVPCAPPSAISWYNKIPRPNSDLPTVEGSVGDFLCDSQLALICLPGDVLHKSGHQLVPNLRKGEIPPRGASGTEKSVVIAASLPLFIWNVTSFLPLTVMDDAPSHWNRPQNASATRDWPNRSQSASTGRSTNSGHLAKKDYAIGILLLLVVVFLWTTSNFVTQKCSETSHHEREPLLSEQVRTDANHVLESTSYTSELPSRSELPPLTTRETAELAFAFCFIWFTANWSLNASLDYTSVASATILSSTSGFFTLGIGKLYNVENLTAVKIGAVSTRFVPFRFPSISDLMAVFDSFVGVLLVALADSSQTIDDDSLSAPISVSARYVLGDFLALFSALFYAFYVILLKVRIRAESRIDMQLFFGFVGLFNIVFCWPIGVLLHLTGVEKFELPTTSKAVAAIIINMAITWSSDFLYVMAMLKTTPLVVTIGLSLTIPLAVMGDFFLSKPTQLQVLAGASLVLTSFVVVGVDDARLEESRRDLREDESPHLAQSDNRDQCNVIVKARMVADGHNMGRLNKRQQRELDEIEALAGSSNIKDEEEEGFENEQPKNKAGFTALFTAESETADEEPKPQSKPKKPRKKKKLVPSNAVQEVPAPDLEAVVHQSMQPLQKSEKKAAKKAKAKAKKAGMPDEIDAALEALSIKHPEFRRNLDNVSPNPMARSLSSLLAVNPAHLDSEAELKRFFGSKVVAASKSDKPGPSSKRAHVAQRSVLTKPRPPWAPAHMREGLSARQLTEEELSEKFDRNGWDKASARLGEEKWWTVEYSKKYKGLVKIFLQIVLSGDPQGFYNLIQRAPWQVDSWLQLAEVFRHREEHSSAVDAVDRAMFAYERAFVGGFSFTNGINRLDFDQVENRPFFLALHRQASDLQRRGCLRTSFEFTKLLYSLDPWSDPHGALLHLDFLAFKADMSEWLLEIFNLFQEKSTKSEEKTCRMDPSVMPGWAYARALALKLSSKEQDRSASTTALIEAADSFPSVIPLLADKLDIALSATVRGHKDFRVETDGRLKWSLLSRSLNTPNAILHLLSHIYVQRSFSLWKEPKISQWFTEVIMSHFVTLPSSLPSTARRNRFLALYTAGESTSALYFAVYRHVMVLESTLSFRSLFSFIPNTILSSKSFACDPLPPPSKVRISEYGDTFFAGIDQEADPFGLGRRTRLTRRERERQEIRLQRLIPDINERRQVQAIYENNPILQQRFPGPEGLLQFVQALEMLPPDALEDVLAAAAGAGGDLADGDNMAMPGQMPGLEEFLLDAGGANVGWDEQAGLNEAEIPDNDEEEEGEETDEHEDEEDITSASSGIFWADFGVAPAPRTSTAPPPKILTGSIDIFAKRVVRWLNGTYVTKGRVLHYATWCRSKDAFDFKYELACRLSPTAMLLERNPSLVRSIPPNTPHSVINSLPTWQDNVDRAQGKQDVIPLMLSSYPRFVLHPLIYPLIDLVLDSHGSKAQTCLLFPSLKLAKAFSAFMHLQLPSSTSAETDPICVTKILHAPPNHDIFAVLFQLEQRMLAMNFWMFNGSGISSRLAENCLHRLDGQTEEVLGLPNDPGQEYWGYYSSHSALTSVAEAKSLIKNRLVGINADGTNIRGVEGLKTSDAYLYPSGMSAIWHMHSMLRNVLDCGERRKSVHINILYVDSYKLLDATSPGYFIFSNDTLGDLEKLLDSDASPSILGIFTDFPGNPHLRSYGPLPTNIRQVTDSIDISYIPMSHLPYLKIPIIIDETVGCHLNVSVLSYADIVVTSLTKIFSGFANVLGGTMLLNPSSRFYTKFKAYLDHNYEDNYCSWDALVMELNSRGLEERLVKVNKNAELLADWLFMRSKAGGKDDTVIDEVFYPKYQYPKNYEHCMRVVSKDSNSGGQFRPGYSGLVALSFTTLEAAKTFYETYPSTYAHLQ
ncbi:hypothetical protein D9757_002816 [Collybiopsis confluens]|uniref:Uncharacterized protein n=1 Tax=Collybiopsis confluens TaxID=2823264 RepID=A0A8H5MDS3_9AGAR|nr:hypothetical protein D9757_002816 [Collybiopsis confluens]